MSSKTPMNVYKVRRTCLEMLHDRGYSNLQSGESFALMAERPYEEYKQHYNEGQLFEPILAQHSTKVSTKTQKIERAYLMAIANPDSQTFQEVQKIITGNDDYDRIIVVSFNKLPKKPVNEKTQQMALSSHRILEIFDSEKLIFNVTKHFLVPKHRLLTETEKEHVLKVYKVSVEQLPVIEYNDPVARYLGLVSGDVVMIMRISQNSGKYVNFRICRE